MHPEHRPRIPERPGRGLTVDELHARRYMALGLLKTGMKQCDVARLLGVTPQRVNVWARKLKVEGSHAWAIRRKGPKSRLTDGQFASVLKMIEDGPASVGYSDGYWTVARVSAKIRSRYGVSYSRTRITELLHRAGFAARRRKGQWRPAQAKT